MNEKATTKRRKINMTTNDTETVEAAEVTPDVLDNMAAEFGIVVAETVPDAPRKQERDEARWNFLTEFLITHPNEWFKVKDYTKAGSAAVFASNINNDKNSRFPEDKYEARYTKDATTNTSSLYLRYKG